ncbi:ALS2 C-terminal-like protein isoform X4 [Halichoerus grypus]
MCSPEEEALLRLEEVFSATLARVNSLVLLPLLETTPEPSDPQGRECLRLLQRLHRSSQRLWEVTEESLHSLRERLCHQDTVGLESLLLLQHAERVLQVHVEYIESYTSCVAVQAFQKAAKKRREFWRGQRKALWQLLPGVSSEASVGTALAQALREPLAHHVQQYVLLLLSLGDMAAEPHRTRELVVHAATLFGNLQSFLRQALDQALATQALWHSLSSRLRDVLCTPACRLLQDSQDVPVTVAPLRAERVLLFDDALVLLQGHSVHTFDLKLVWVDPGQDGCTFHLLTPEEELSFCSKAPQDRMVWQWKVTQAVCQALRGKKDFPVLGADLEPSEPPTCRCMAYTFRAEGRLCQATYEGEWCRGRPHGRGTLKWPDGRNHVGNFCQGLEHGFGIRLVPQGPEDRFDCYKCHWREGRMCGYGISVGGPLQVRHRRGVQGLLPGGPAARIWGPRERPAGPAALQVHGPLGEGPAERVRRRGGRCQGPGILLSEDDSLYEGTFTRDLTLVGKAARCGRLPRGEPLAGCLWPLPGLRQCWLPWGRAGGPAGLPRAELEGAAQVPGVPVLREALSNSLHPLGKLLRTLMLTFQATYAGIGANKHLQALAQEEVKQHARELWAAYRGLLQVALQRKGQAPEEDEDTETRDLQVHGLVLPLMLPSFYSELFTLYLLLHETEDSLYSQGIANLSLFPDTKLLEFLDVQKHLWPLKDLTLTTNQRLSLVRDKCFLSATECLQKIITTVDPREKLEVLERTYGEIEATVSRVLGREHKLPMDDLLPLLIYVVSRARIQHLGAEIHLIRDMMDPIHTGGLCDFLLTALESCYEHIQKEDMRLHRFAGRWDSREPW